MHVAVASPVALASTSACPRRRQPTCAGRTHTSSLTGGLAPHSGAWGEGQRQHWAVAASAAARQQQSEPAAPEAEQMNEEWIEVGKIGPPHGVRGEMKVQPLTDFPEDRLGTPGPRWLQAPAPKIGRRQAAEAEEVELEWGRTMISKGNEVWLVKLADVESPEEAALLRGHTLLIPASARPPLEDEDEFYVQDLVGLQVFMQASGEEVGHVSDVFDGTGTHDVLRIQLAPSQLARLAAARQQGGGSQEGEGEEQQQQPEEEGWDPAEPRHVLLPFAKPLVPLVDLKGRRMEITPPEGLLELAAPSNTRRVRKENRGRRQRRRTRPRGQSAVDAAASGSSSGSGGGGSEDE